MPRYTLPILGLEIAFKTDADAGRVNAAKAYVEELFTRLNQGGKNLSKEKLLTVLALSLADETLLSRQKLKDLEAKLGTLLAKAG
jgi:cell division protein ZapA